MLGNYKIKVNGTHPLEYQDILDVASELGYANEDWGNLYNVNYLFLNDDDSVGFSLNGESVSDDYQELTLPQLRDMVVLYRNDVDDWNCVDPEFKEQKLYLCSDKTLHIFDDVRNYWKVSSKNGINLVLNRLIMKEDQSLNNLINGNSEQDLISGADAKLAWVKGDLLQINKKDTHFGFIDMSNDYSLGVFDNDNYEFRLKPRTIKLNGLYSKDDLLKLISGEFN